MDLNNIANKKVRDFFEHRDKMKNDPEYAKKVKEDMEKETVKNWNELKPFIVAEDVPEIPNPTTEFYTNRLIELGAIPKLNLVVDEWYYGEFRRANFAKWNGKCFDYIRFKFGFYWDTCDHFQDDKGWAVFVPIRKATNEEILNELNKKILGDRNEIIP